MSFGQRLMELRKSKHLSQEEVAEKLNVTRQTISKWETDQSTPDFDKIIPLCDLYGITSNELLTGEKKIVSPPLEEQKIKRAQGIGLGVFCYFLSVIWIMLAIPVWNMNPIVASAIFLLLCGAATFIIIYTSILYKKEKKEKEKNTVMKQIEDILAMCTCIVYLGISFLTMAWHITWIIWLIYALVIQIIKLILLLRGVEDEK